jgi:predicted nucleic acid-binding protein
MRSFVVDSNILFSALYDPDSKAGKLVLSAIEGKVILSSTEHVKEEMSRILSSKLGYSKEWSNGIIKDLPVNWMDKRVYQDLLREEIVLKVGEADCSLVVCSYLLNHPLVTGDKKLRGIGSIIVEMVMLKDIEY